MISGPWSPISRVLMMSGASLSPGKNVDTPAAGSISSASSMRLAQSPPVSLTHSTLGTLLSSGTFFSDQSAPSVAWGICE